MTRSNQWCNGHLGGYIGGGDPQTYDPGLWEELLFRFGAKSVVDMGCAEGHSTRWFAEHGCEVLGIEGWEKPIREGVWTATVLHDYVEGPYCTGRAWDLCWCCEFLEHVEARYWPNVLATLSECRIIALTHAYKRNFGWHHINCQKPEYWIARLSPEGYRFDGEATAAVCAKAKPESHFQKRGMIFIREVGA